MWNRTGVKSTALERAQAQLSGRRVFNKSNDGSRDDLQEYIDALTKKTNALHLRHTYEDLDDISSDDRESVSNNGATDAIEGQPMLKGLSERPRGGEGSRFLKKATPHPMTSSQSPMLSKTGAHKEELKSAASSLRGSHSAALCRLALIEDRFRNRFQAREGRDTDPPPPEATPPSAQSSGELSMKGSRFLKKRSTPITQQQSPEPNKTYRPTAAQLRSSGKGISLDSDEEDMKKLLGGTLESSDESLLKEHRLPSQESPQLVKKSFMKSNQRLTPAHSPFAGQKTPSRTKNRSPSPPSRGSPRHSGIRAHLLRSPSYSLRSVSMALSPTPTPPNIPSPGRTMTPRAKFLRPSLSSVSMHSEVKSLDELFPDAPTSDNTISERSETSDAFKINILSLDNLVPETSGAVEASVEKQKKNTADSLKKTERPSDGLNVVLVEDLLSEEEIQSADDKVEYESDFESEIQTEPDQSMSEISEHLGHREKDASRASEQQDEVSERTHGPSPEERRSRTERSVSYSSHSESNRSNASFSGSRRGSYSRSSASDSLSDTITSFHEKCKPSVKEAAVQTQTEGLSYTWSSGLAALGPSIGMSHVDPTPIASHVISAEAVEALTAYSPAVFALNDMLRQQLALTKQIMEVSRHLHTSLLESLGPANYRYTTLEDTREYIQSHKSPKLTVEEALEEVLQEMKEYHYI
ncbi:hypothetical protein AGOR_G00147230 [Albula goreensis]|uniref:DUF4614 domain-containing protein n=1 Tax=Albula goreensis TaxID=1534307 RepID=A0A8T3DAY6_9TELE|nr:hypothetical protein AGOR_G00147230 [Albula goreensis]